MVLLTGATGTYNFRAGLRAEHTDVNGNFKGSKTVVDQHYTNLIPNILISKKVSSSYTISLSYNMRLQRPYITNLNPFINNNDSLNIYYGNPRLGPQVLHAVSLQNRLVKGKFFGAFTINASYTNNMIVQYAAFNKSTGVTSFTSDNIGEELQLNAGINMNATIGEKLSIGFSPLIRFNHIRNKSNPLLDREGISGNAFTNFSYRRHPEVYDQRQRGLLSCTFYFGKYTEYILFLPGELWL
jgi:hypothetical protein